MKVRFHRHGRRDAASYAAFSASWKESISGPDWMTADVQVDRMAPWDRPTSRDWMSIESGSGLNFLGRVSTTSWVARAGDSGATVAGPIQVSSRGFLDTDEDVVASPGVLEKIGTMFPSEEWYNTALVPFITSRDLGAALSALVKLVFRGRLPESISGGGGRPLGEALWVAYSDGTAIGESMPMEPVQGFTANGLRTMFRQSNKTSQLILGTFQPNAQLIELTPVIIPASSDRSAQSNVPAVLGGKLCVRFRMAPFRPSGVSARMRPISRPNLAPATSSILPPTQSIAVGGSFDSGVFDFASWKALPLRTVRDFVSLNANIDGAAEVNAASAWLSQLTGGDDLQVCSVLGLPVFDGDRINRDGLRLATTTWPFMPAVGLTGDAKMANVIKFTRYLAATYFQFQSPGAHFESGSAELSHFDPSYKPGIRVEFPVRFETGIRRLTAYLTEVSHSVVSRDNDGHVEGKTTLIFKRGLWDEALRDPEIPVYAPPPDVPALTSTSAASPLSTDFASGCMMGKPVTGGFLKNSLASVNGVVTTDLQISKDSINWGNLACLREWFIGSMSPGLQGAARDVLNGDGGGTAAENLSRCAWAHVAAATAYTIYRYWKQVWPDASILVSSFYRVGDGVHGDAHAFDFMVNTGNPNAPPPSALRSWAALKYLANAGRIPPGGRGLYLNVNPTTGIQDVTQAGAGQSSAGSAPTGGSAGTHYDARGWFGIPAVNGTSDTKWIATDFTGDGKDEFQLAGNDITTEAGILQYPSGQFSAAHRAAILAASAGSSISAISRLALLKAKVDAIWDLNDVMLSNFYWKVNIADTYGDLARIYRYHYPYDPVGTLVATTRVVAMITARPLLLTRAQEIARLPLRDAISAYYQNEGAHDASLHDPDESVPNVHQVLNIEGGTCFRCVES